MNELKWKVIQEVIVAKARSTGNHDEETDDAADRVLQHFAEAMLSDTAVEAVAKVLYSHYPARAWHTPIESTALPWEETAREDRVGKCKVARKQITAALKAIGATDTDD